MVGDTAAASGLYEPSTIYSFSGHSKPGPGGLADASHPLPKWISDLRRHRTSQSWIKRDPLCSGHLAVPG